MKHKKFNLCENCKAGTLYNFRKKKKEKLTKEEKLAINTIKEENRDYLLLKDLLDPVDFATEERLTKALNNSAVINPSIEEMDAKLDLYLGCPQAAVAKARMTEELIARIEKK